MAYDINLDGRATYLLGRRQSLLLALALLAYFPPLGGSSLSWSSTPFIVVLVVIVTSCCDPIQLSSWSRRLQWELFSTIAMPSKLSLRPSGGIRCRRLIGLALHSPQPLAAINRHCPWAAWIDPSPPPMKAMANDIALLPIPSPFSHANVSCSGAVIAGVSRLSILL